MLKLAALDLGSNSFHLLDAVYNGESLQFGQRIKEKVQLGAGLDLDHNLSQRAINRGLDCLKSFQSYIEKENIEQLVAVGTNTLRIANNSDDFITAAEAILNIPVQILSGKDEAKLIFSAVYNEMQTKDTGLVIDIGGGSTEFAIGNPSDIQLAESLEMGCVSYYQRFFADGKIYSENVRAAEKAARLEIEPYLQKLVSLPKQWLAGTSGTMQSIAILAHHHCNDLQGVLSRQSIDSLESKLIDSGHIKNMNFQHLESDRRAILPAGLAIVRAIFNALNIEQLQICQSSLCEGLLQQQCNRLD